MYIDVYIYIYTYIHTHVITIAGDRKRGSWQTGVRMFGRALMYIYIYIYIYAHTHMYVYIYIYIYICRFGCFDARSNCWSYFEGVRV